MSLFKRVSKQEPCPVCGKDNWCQFGDRAVKCMRVESAHPAQQGGWYHFYDEIGLAPVKVEPVAPAPKQAVDAAKLMRQWRARTHAFQLEAVAQALGVLPEAVVALGAAWSPEYAAWAFPMRDEYGETIGVRLRKDRHKWTVTGTKEGLFLPEPSVRLQPLVFCPEGPTNSAALLSLGFYVIGRPSCNSGHDLLAKALKRLQVYKAVIVADNDPVKRLGNKEGRPGITGAEACKKRLGVNSCYWVPPSPCKDARDFVRAGGTKAFVEDCIKTQVWSKK